MATADETTMNDSTEVTNDNVEINTNIQLNLESDSLTEVINPKNVSSQNNCVPKTPEGEDILSQNKLLTNNDLETQNAIPQNQSATDKGTILESCSENDVLNNAIAKEKCVAENLTKSTAENNSIMKVSDASLITNKVSNCSSNSTEVTVEASIGCVKKEITENSIAKENTVDEPEEAGILCMLNFHEKPFWYDVYKYIKNNTTYEIHGNIDGVLIRNQKDKIGVHMAMVVLKSKEIALTAKWMLENVLLKKIKEQPYDGPILLLNRTFKRPAPVSDDERVPQKRIKLSEDTYTTMPSNNKSKILYIAHLPTTWCFPDVEKYIRGNLEPSVAESILYIYVDKINKAPTFTVSCHVLFDDMHKCTLALNELKRHNANNGFVVKYEFPHSKFAIPWTRKNKPNFKLINIKESFLGRQYSDQKAGHAIKTNESVHIMNLNVARNSPNLQFRHSELKYEDRPIWNHKQNNENTNLWGSIQSNSSLFSENCKETYGLSLEFLKSKDIQPPLTAKVYVKYLPIQYNSDNQVRKLFQHAGRVTAVTHTLREGTDIVTATVCYDHPLEAVQAVLMFNGQKIGNKNKIKVKMDQSPDLYAFGGGLGPDGEIMKNVRNTIQLKQHMDKIMNKLESMEKSIDSLRQSVESLQQSIQDKGQKDNAPICKPELTSALRALLNPQAAPHLQLLQQQITSNYLQQPQASASAQAQTASWNNNQPSNAQSLSLGFRAINQGTTNVLPVPNARMGFMQDKANMKTFNMHGGYTNANFNSMLFQDMANLAAGQIAQGSNMAFGHYGQGIQNASNTRYIQGDSNVSANMPPQYVQGAQNVPTQFAQTAQNVPTHFAQTAQNVPTQYAQTAQNVPSQFAQGAQNVPPQIAQATQNLPSQLSQGAQNVPSQFSHGAQNMLQQYVEAAQNVPPQIAQGTQYAQMLQNEPLQVAQEAQNMPQQIAQAVQNMPQQIAQAVQNMPQQIAQAAQNMPQQIAQAAQNMPQQISQGAQNLATKIAQGAQNVSLEFVQGVKNSQVSQNVPAGQWSKRSNAPPQNPQNDSGLFGKSEQNSPHGKNDKNRPSPSLKSKSEKKNESRDKYTVRFSHLPSSVTRQSLKTKMSELGEVRDVEMLGPGRARVTFCSSRDAADCIKLLDHTKVDGQTIEVKYD